MMGAIAELRRAAGRAKQVRERWGVKGVVARGADKVLVYATYPIYKARLKDQTFCYRGEPLPYFVHHYNATWRNERMVEVPVAERFLRDRRHQRGLEIGNVLGYYMTVSHTVVDKYERAPGVINIDVVDYQPETPFDWIMAVSTLEHVGWDETPRQPEKLADAIRHLRTLLNPGGRLFVTSPRGVNSFLDGAIVSGLLQPTEETFMHRDGGHAWREDRREDALGRRPQYDLVGRNAFDLWVAEFDSERR